MSFIGLIPFARKTVAQRHTRVRRYIAVLSARIILCAACRPWVGQENLPAAEIESCRLGDGTSRFD
jgi:hypothetical protein